MFKAYTDDILREKERRWDPFMIIYTKYTPVEVSTSRYKVLNCVLSVVPLNIINAQIHMVTNLEKYRI